MSLPTDPPRPESAAPTHAPPVEIREVVREDLDALRGLLGAVDAFRPDEVDCAIEVVEEFLAGDGGYSPNLLWSEGRAAGFLCHGPVPLTDGTWDLYWIAVHPEARGAGHGRRLMDHLVEDVRRAGGRLIVIETSSLGSHEGARRLYEACGFREAARIAAYYAPGDDLVIYRREVGGGPGGTDGEDSRRARGEGPGAPPP